MNDSPHQPAGDTTDPLAEDALRRGLAKKNKFPWGLVWMIAAATCGALLVFGPFVAGVALIFLIAVAWLGSVTGRL